jgi:hypothetical protein
MSDNDIKDLNASAEAISGIEINCRLTDCDYSVEHAASLKQVDVEGPDQCSQIDNQLENIFGNEIQIGLNFSHDVGTSGNEQQQDPNCGESQKNDENEEKYVNCCVEVRNLYLLEYE